MKTNLRISKGCGMRRHNRRFVLLFVGLLVLSGSMGFPTIPKTSTTENKAAAFLTRYGYLNQPELDTRAGFRSIDVFENAIKELQKFANINVTGTLDKDTLKLMNTPRCGLPDKKISNSVSSSPQKRYVIEGSRWEMEHISYRVKKYSKKLSESSIDSELQRAFREWSKVTPLKFTRKTSGKANIDIRFEVGDHDDGDPFDGPGQTLAHAFFPESGGDLHFDDDESWTIRTHRGENFFQVAVHEIGHSLGLDHSPTSSAVMYPYYRGYVPDFELDRDDITGIQTIYGPPDDYASPETTETNQTPTHPDLCDDEILDVIFESTEGLVNVFKGSHHWKLNDSAIEIGYPKPISSTWAELPCHIDAAFTSGNGRTYFFKGSKYWKYNGKILQNGYPKDISSGFVGIPNNIDATMWWTPAAKTYFFKGSQFWVYDQNATPHVKSTYPKPIANMKGIPNDLDDVLFNKNRLYFFKDGKYYRYDDFTFEADDANPPYPRNAKRSLFGCERS